MKGKKGITLIALIITIIVMLILVGVTINVALNGGIFEKAKDATTKTQKEVEKEELISAAVGAYNSKNDSVLLSDLTNAIDTSKYMYDEDKSGEDTYVVIGKKSGTYWKIDLKTAEVREWKEQVVENVWVNDREFSSTAVKYGATYTGNVTLLHVEGVRFTSFRLTADGGLNGTMDGGGNAEIPFSYSNSEVNQYLNIECHVRNGNILFIATNPPNYNAFVFENDENLGYIVKIYNGNYSTDYVNDIVTNENYCGYLSAQ